MNLEKIEFIGLLPFPTCSGNAKFLVCYKFNECNANYHSLSTEVRSCTWTYNLPFFPMKTYNMEWSVWLCTSDLTSKSKLWAKNNKKKNKSEWNAASDVENSLIYECMVKQEINRIRGSRRSCMSLRVSAAWELQECRPRGRRWKPRRRPGCSPLQREHPMDRHQSTLPSATTFTKIK